MVFAVTEIVLEIVTLGLEGIEALVLDLPPGATAVGELGHIGLIDRQVGDEAVAVGGLACGVGDFDRQPVDLERIRSVAQRQVAQPTIAIDETLAPTLGGFLQRRKLDSGEIFLQRGVRIRRNCSPRWMRGSRCDGAIFGERHSFQS